MYLLDLIAQLDVLEAEAYHKADLGQPCLNDFFYLKIFSYKTIAFHRTLDICIKIFYPCFKYIFPKATVSNASNKYSLLTRCKSFS